VTNAWAPAHERTILWNDPDLDIDWPLARGMQPLLSPRDAAAMRFRDAEHYP
jgi:dTDP-4-dehydrorhamnose 3,5-epimerase